MKDTLAAAEMLILEWRNGYPPKPWSEEWFIAVTTYGDKVVLRSLPEEYTYDFKTADDTYIRKDKIKKWMQFPDSKYIAPENATDLHTATVEALDKCENGVGGRQYLLEAVRCREKERDDALERLAAAEKAIEAMKDALEFQHRVAPWMEACFGSKISADTIERNHRFIEEALELVQSCDATKSECHQLVDYVYGRPIGEKRQEVGGVMVTLAALCLAQGIDMHNAGDVELTRIWGKVDQIRAKQAAKPKHSPLPEYEGRKA